MKKLLIALAVFTSTNIYAIDENAKLAGSQKKAVERIKNSLQISDSAAYKVYTLTMENWTGEKEDTDWYYTSIDNESLASSKFKNSPTKFLQFKLASNNRLVNATLISFSEYNQVYVQLVETLPRTATLIINKQNELKKDKKYDEEKNTSQYSVFSEKGKANETFLFANNGVGTVQYISSFTVDISSN